jgi:hypothetical protein
VQFMLRRRLWKKKLRVPVNTCCSRKASWRMEERKRKTDREGSKKLYTKRKQSKDVGKVNLEKRKDEGKKHVKEEPLNAGRMKIWKY